MWEPISKAGDPIDIVRSMAYDSPTDTLFAAGNFSNPDGVIIAGAAKIKMGINPIWENIGENMEFNKDAQVHTIFNIPERSQLFLGYSSDDDLSGHQGMCSIKLNESLVTVKYNTGDTYKLYDGSVSFMYIKDGDHSKWIVENDKETESSTDNGATTTESLTVSGATTTDSLTVSGATTTDSLTVSVVMITDSLAVNGDATTDSLTVNGHIAAPNGLLVSAGLGAAVLQDTYRNVLGFIQGLRGIGGLNGRVRFVKTNGTWTPIHCIIPDIEPGPNEKYFKIIQKNCVIKQPPLGHKITLNAESPAGIYKIHFDCDVGGGAPGGVEFGIFIAEKPVPDVVGILTSEGKGTVSLTHFYEYNGTSPPAIEVMVKGVEGGHFVYILRTCFFVERVLMGTV